MSVSVAAALAKLLTSVGGADPNAADAKGETPLIAAVRAAASSTPMSDVPAAFVSALLDVGADPNKVNSARESPLSLALGKPELMRLLLSSPRTADSSSRDSPPPAPAQLIAKTDQDDRSRAEVEASADLTLAAVGGESASAVTRTARPPIAGLRAAADPNIRLARGNTALHLAAAVLDATSVSLLLSAGANPWIHNDAGDLPLKVAAAAGSAAEDVQPLQGGPDRRTAEVTGDVGRTEIATAAAAAAIAADLTSRMDLLKAERRAALVDGSAMGGEDEGAGPTTPQTTPLAGGGDGGPATLIEAEAVVARPTAIREKPMNLVLSHVLASAVEAEDRLLQVHWAG